MWRLRNAAAAAAFAVAAIFGSAASASMRVDPMIIDMVPTARGSTASVQITNVTDIDLPVEMTVVKRILVNGKQQLVPADDDFVIFPPQFMLKPGETQTVRLQWVVGKAPATSESYYVYATQVPVPLKKGESGVVVSYRFGISVQMIPPGAEPKLEVVSIAPAKNDKGVSGFDLTVRDDGTRFTRMAEYSMDLSSGADSKHWSPDEVKKITGVGFMLPGETHQYFIPFEGALGATPSVKLEQSLAQN